MKCDLGHDHPPMEVVGATENPTQPWGPRPYHCPDCFYVTKPGAVPGYWVKYPNPASAVAAGHRSPCLRCFPA
jgi:hypothetical protein